MSPGVIAQLRIKSSVALFAENQSEVPNNWATTMTMRGYFTLYVLTFYIDPYFFGLRRLTRVKRIALRYTHLILMTRL